MPATGNDQSEYLITDPQVTRIGYWMGASHKTVFFGLPHGEHWRDVPRRVKGALSPDGSLLLDTSGATGVTLVKTDNPAWRLTLTADHAVTTSFQPSFSPDGKLAAWGTAEGTVFIAELAEVLKQLKAARLGLPSE